MSEATSVSVSSECLSNAADTMPELVPQDSQTLTVDTGEKVLSADEPLDKSAVDDGADDIIESSSPLRRDHDDDDDDAASGGGGLLSTSFVVPLTTTDSVSAACNSVIPAALSSVPSLMQLSRRALDSQADRTRDEPAVSSSVTSHVIADMFSEDDEQNDSMAEMTVVR